MLLLFFTTLAIHNIEGVIVWVNANLFVSKDFFYLTFFFFFLGGGGGVNVAFNTVQIIP